MSDRRTLPYGILLALSTTFGLLVGAVLGSPRIGLAIGVVVGVLAETINRQEDRQI